MTVEILFPEVCGLFGDSQNPTYLNACLPDSEFIQTSLLDEPYFVNNTPDMIYIGSMSESTQRKVIEKLQPHKERLLKLIDSGVPMLATGNAGDIFTQKIEYVTENITTEGLGYFDLNVNTDLFRRYNGKVLAQFEDQKIVGFRSQFSFVYGDNSANYFAKCIRGDGINQQSKLEGFRRSNLICTQILGPILPLNPYFCEYFIGLTGTKCEAAYRDAAIAAYDQHIQEFSDPKVVFGNNK